MNLLSLDAISTAARWVQKAGGSRAAQDRAALAAKTALDNGASGASALEHGYKIGRQLDRATTI